MNTLAEQIILHPAEPQVIASRARVRVADCGPGAARHGRHAAEIAIDEPALRLIQAHALSDAVCEVAGVLLGPWPTRNGSGRYSVHIVDAIVARHTYATPTVVRFTADSWKACEQQRLQRYPDESMIAVGWYHSHPGHGLFLSGDDRSLHAAVFSKLWQVALVAEPRERSAEFFTWTADGARLIPYDFTWPAWAKETF